MGTRGSGQCTLIDVDVVRLKTTQRILKLLENTLARGVPFDLPVLPIESDFGGKDNALPAPVLADGFTDDFLQNAQSRKRALCRSG